MKFIMPAAVLAATLGMTGAAVLPAPHAAAQTATPATQAPTKGPAQQHIDRARLVDGRIAFLKAVLRITPEQEPQWSKVAATIRDSMRERQNAFEQMRAERGQHHSAIARLELHQRFETLRAQDTERFLVAFRPLYASLSSDQKQAADDLFAHFGHRGHHFGRH